jgi:hypothetical protein
MMRSRTTAAPARPVANVSDVRARFAAAARQRSAIEADVAARLHDDDDDVVDEPSPLLFYVALYFELIGWVGFAVALFVRLAMPQVTSVGLWTLTIPIHAGLGAFVWTLVVCGGYAVNGWLLRHRRRVGAYGAMATLGLALASEFARGANHPLLLLVPLLGMLGVRLIWDETE